ncbi:MAG: radical SAM protein, partial [Thermodesulfovibrionales bacterium]|nr:radical SAM protein [Thermodesulfovibrionales bacterium]
GYGPARNIVAFTGGDLTCNAEWYCQSAEKIKELNLDLRVLLETNGYGLTPKNLDLFKEGGVDSFWLDIKAWNNDVHMKLTGAENAWILRLPEEILKRDFTLEVLTLYIPGWVETDQIKEIAKHLAKTSSEIPFTILAFFGEYKLKGLQSPNLYQMLDAYCVSKEAGLKNIRMGNIHLFVKTDRDYQILMELAEEAI